MPTRTHSLVIKKRFIQAVDRIVKDNYPDRREVDIIKAVGFLPSNYSRMKENENFYPTLDNCYELCSQFNISASWLLMGKGTMKDVDIKTITAAELIEEALTKLKAASSQTVAQTKVRSKHPKKLKTV